MSLLMDALKKAELAKREGQGESASGPTGTDGTAELTLKPLSEPEYANSGVGSSTPATPPLNAHLEELDARFLEEAEQAAAARLKTNPPTAPSAQASSVDTPRPMPGASTEPKRGMPDRNFPGPAAQSAAQNLFAVKHAETPPSRKTFAVVVGTITVLAVCGIGGYFWWQLQPKSPPVAMRGPLPASPAAVVAPAAVAPPPTPVLAPMAAAPAAASPAMATAPARPAARDDDDDVAPAAARAPARARRPTTVTAAADQRDSPIRVTRAPLKVNPVLIRGFDAFNRGDLATAQLEYERAQKADPRNTDALHGLAAIALRQGRPEQAEQLYRRIAETDPQDTVALAALINGRGQVDPNVAESRLKSLAAAQPELAAPHFSLGNLYARHGRWNDAQQAYFRAHNAEPDNPDILYNLAISLEHLRQNKVAAQYYSQAIAAAQNRPAGFDKAQATARLQSLQQP